MKTVERGASLLDERFGKRWDEKIDLEALDLGNICNCVLGQLYGPWELPSGVNPYRKGVRELGLEDKRGSPRHGFTDGFASFDRLTEAWRELIERRRKIRHARRR